MQGYCYAALQLVKYIYGLSWLQKYLESVLPAEVISGTGWNCIEQSHEDRTLTLCFSCLQKVVAQEHGSTPQQQAYIDVYSGGYPSPAGQSQPIRLQPISVSRLAVCM